MPISYPVFEDSGYEDSMFDEINRRIKELQRKSYRWVKGAPEHKYQMCAIVDNRTGTNNTVRLSQRTITAMNMWLHRNTRWTSITDFNDSMRGAGSVDEVIAMFEKFRAEL